MTTRGPLRWRCPRCGGELGSFSNGTRSISCPRCRLAAGEVGGVWRFAEDFEPEGFPAERHGGLAAIEDRHFWFAARDRLIVRRLGHHLAAVRSDSARRKNHDDQPRVLDLGCGSGRVLARLGGLELDLVGVEGHAEPLARAALRHTGATLVHADGARLPFADGQFDAVLMLDVLEHTEAEVLLAEARRVTRAEGGLLVSVPAYPWLWSDMDVRAGHLRRYTLGTLRRELAASSWRLAAWTHYQFFLLPLVIASRFLARRSERALERRPPRWLDALLGRVNRLEVDLLAGVSLPWGSSVMAWAWRR